MKNFKGGLVAAVMLAVASTTAAANERLNIILNWTPGADHAPIYYALSQGWYSKAGIDLTVTAGRGSAGAAQSVGVGANQIGISELGTAFVARGQGANLVAVMSLYANAPFVFYWKKSSGIKGVKDFPGHTIGNPPADAARVLWPAFANAAGIPVDSVKFVNIAPQAKVPTLAAGQVDIISNFYNGHDVSINTFGDDLGFILWSSLGLNPYGNSFIVNGDYLKSHRSVVASFVQVTQRAYAECVKESERCIDALMKAASGLDRAQMVDQWKRVTELMTDQYTTSIALGYLDPGRVAETYKLINTYFKIDKAFDPAESFTDDFLSKDIKMKAP